LAKELQLNAAAVKYKLLLDQKENGQTAWFLAAKRDNLKLLKELGALTKEKGNPDKINSKFLLACTEYGDTVLHVAAEGSVTVLEKLWPFLKKPN
jgi:ankyrin repeat protein